LRIRRSTTSHRPRRHGAACSRCTEKLWPEHRVLIQPGQSYHSERALPMPSTVTLCDISSQHLPASVPYAVLAPSRDEALPLCILLLGAGGTRDSIFDLQPLFDGWWDDGTVPPMIIATPTSGLDYYMEDPAGPVRWDSFLAGDFVPHLRSTCNVCDSTVIAGTSGLDYYMEDPAGPVRWDSFLAGDFVPHLRSTCNVCDSTVIAGISGGGYGALKLAFM